MIRKNMGLAETRFRIFFCDLGKYGKFIEMKKESWVIRIFYGKSYGIN
jgi:hypothetical protein